MPAERFPVEEGAILTFARAIGDPNPIYADVEYARSTEFGTVIAPPTFVQSSAHFDPDYPLRPKIGQPWFGSGRTPSGTSGESASPGRGQGTGLHAEQHYTYHRPLRAGDVLSASVQPGRSWEKEGRSGKLRFSESITEYRAQDGELVVTARSVGVMTEGPVKKEA
jgi:acyl dehydratase